MEGFTGRILKLRKEKHLTQEAIAAQIGITSRTYQRYETGEREPTLSTLVRMADLFGVSLDYLAGRTEE